jgi:drug/metabolite transporter (DMT)-like permease
MTPDALLSSFMKSHSNATSLRREAPFAGHALRPGAAGLLWGALGVLAFSFTLPATRLAVADLDGTIVGLGRAIVAGILAALMLAATRQKLPPRRLWFGLSVVAFGCVLGFPLFSAIALKTVPAAHGAVIVGLLPAATAVMAVLRAGERPSPAFWIASLCGLVAVLAFAVAQGAGLPQPADGLILIAVILGALGYAEGGVLARELGAWQVISWALVLSAPMLIPVVALRIDEVGLAAGLTAWLGFAYVSVVSMFLGFFAWYRGLAIGGVARVGQIQLIQPILTLLWSALLLGEQVTPATVIAALAVLASVALTQRTRVGRKRGG